MAVVGAYHCQSTPRAFLKCAEAGKGALRRVQGLGREEDNHMIPPWRQFRDLSIEDCPWEDIRPMLLAYVACQHLCLQCCKPFKSICEFHSMLEDQSGDLSKPGTRIPKYLPQLEALDLVLVRNECEYEELADDLVGQQAANEPYQCVTAVPGFRNVQRNERTLLMQAEVQCAEPSAIELKLLQMLEQLARENIKKLLDFIIHHRYAFYSEAGEVRKCEPVHQRLDVVLQVRERTGRHVKVLDTCERLRRHADAALGVVVDHIENDQLQNLWHLAMTSYEYPSGRD
ncbi:hypothetical protein FISHEDRAFT_70328 [Fistulina hepatica ATCC 64428]|uniref:Uncharacterized protein n=1 Tax=Fistulina hepatica ATCC 64428 TaxID=1128425 RepID=A0A0D7ALB2_9AGAR|nr:hypothetical protein FISHEDRAFT_70328 [Fistulina hepatica ATCC 64428]